MKRIWLSNLRKTGLLLLGVVFVYLQTSCSPLLPFSSAFDPPKSPPIKPPQATKIVLAKTFDPLKESDVAREEIYQLLLAKDFDAIEKAAGDAREKKQRLTGGYWKLDAIYDALSNIYSEYPGQAVTDEVWNDRLELLKRWKKNSAESITPRVALAASYTNYGWFARGSGYANAVSKENYRLLYERLVKAEKELFEARDLDKKCTRWFRELLFVGMAKGWPLDEYNELLEEAIKSEPTYLQFYLIQSENLTPNWNGKKGSWRNFIDSLPGELAELETDEADIIFFFVVANKLREPSVFHDLGVVSNERVKKGFADLEEKFGVDNFRLNQFALASFIGQDFTSARKAFERIGDKRDKDVWDEKTFNQMKAFIYGRRFASRK